MDMKSNVEAELVENYEKQRNPDPRGDVVIKTEYEETEIKIENFDDNLVDLHHSIDIKEEDEVQSIKKRQNDSVLNHSIKVFPEEVYLKRTFVCDSCGYQTTRKSCLKMHMKAHILNKLEGVCATDSKEYQIRQATLNSWWEKNDKLDVCSEELTNASGLRSSLSEEENAEVLRYQAVMKNEDLSTTCSTMKAILVKDTCGAKLRNCYMNAHRRHSLKKGAKQRNYRKIYFFSHFYIIEILKLIWGKALKIHYLCKKILQM